MPEPPTTPNSARPSEGNERLDSWKAIAAYLKRDVRTVQRWEESEGLPVHRHVHKERGSVYALASELDRWCETRRSRSTPHDLSPASRADPSASGNGTQSVEAPPADLGIPRARAVDSRWFLRATVVLICLAILAVGVLYYSSSRPERRLSFNARDLVLITDFQNRTGEPNFDGTIEFALGRDLSDSRYVSIVPRERVQDVLRLMKKPLSSRVDSELGREVCIRDGGIRAMLTGRIEKFGSKYMLSAELWDPIQSSSAASITQTASAPSDLPTAIRRLTDKVRESLGENLALVHQSDAKLEKVSTVSLLALKHYSQAITEGDGKGSAALLRLATQEDPQFASAQIELAWSLFPYNEEYREHAESAIELSDTATEREQLFIHALHTQISGAGAEAADLWRAYLKLYPDDVWATHRLTIILGSSGHFDEAVSLRRRLADLLPNNFQANVWAAVGMATGEGDLAAAQPYLRRARALESQENETTQEDAWLRLFPTYQAWLHDDLVSVERDLSVEEKALQPPGEVDHDALIDYVALFNSTLGKIRTAENWYARSPDPTYRAYCLAITAFERNDKGSFEAQIPHIQENFFSSTLGSLLVLEGHSAEAERRMAWFVGHSRVDRESVIEVVRGELALARGNVSEGIRLIREGLPYHQNQNLGGADIVYFIGSQMLAEAYDRLGKTPNAIAVLEDASKQRGRIYGFPGPNGDFWIRSQEQLADLYRKAGRKGDADAIDTELLALLKDADPDFPPLQKLKRPQVASNKSF